MPSAPYDLSISATRAGALFASPLRRTDEPRARQVRRAIATATGVHGVRGCAARVAQAYGEHPQTPLTPMHRALTPVASAVGSSPAGPARAPAPGHSTMTCTSRTARATACKFPRHATRPLTATGHKPGCERAGDARYLPPARHQQAHVTWHPGEPSLPRLPPALRACPRSP
jgi:hypothetical protein